MKKWLWRIAILTVALGCISNFALPSQELKSLPASAAEWRLADQTVLKPVPTAWKNFRSGEYARKAWRGAYSGALPVTVTVYEMPSYPAAGWSAIQQWRVVPGKMAFFKGGYFGIAESSGATLEELLRFVRGVETALPPGNETLR